MSKDQESLLIIEDDAGLQKQLKWSFDGYQVVLAGDAESAMAQLRRYEPRVAVLDLGLPPDPANASVGLALLESLLAAAPHTKVIVMTGNTDKANAVQAIGLGAYDFCQKPVDPQVLGFIVERASQLHRLEEANRRLSRLADNNAIEGFVAQSAPMEALARKVEKLAPTDITVLLAGESGTGKEVLARGLHQLSARRDEPFVAINCAAIPETLLESELFGYEKGAFTGAAKQTLGKIEMAEKGTLFLDEIGDMPLALQAKLLRFLEERVVERLGGRGGIAVDVRLVCATNQNLGELIGAGQFREDLYYRVSETTLSIPPLRERDNDVVLIAQFLLEQYKDKLGKAVSGFTQDAKTALTRYHWPGNIRQLSNCVKQALVMSEGKRITAADLGLEAVEGQDLPFNLRAAREEAEKRVVHRAMAFTGGNVSQAAELLGIARPTLYSLLDKFGSPEAGAE